MKPAPLFLALATLAGCAAFDASAPSDTVDRFTHARLQDAVTFYGIVKGLALVAEVATPASAPLLTAGIAALDPLAARARVVLDDAAADEAVAANLAAAITEQAKALAIAAAPSIKVVGN